MKKLIDLVELVEDNKNCVLLKVKDGSQLDMILLGCFSGDESMIRLAKDEYNTITVFYKDGKNYWWASNERVSDSTRLKMRMIYKCVYQLTGYETRYIYWLIRDGKEDEIYE